MILLPLLDVVFVNLVGADPGHVQKQLAMVLEDNRAVAKKVAPADAAALARHDERATEIVKDMHVDGLVSSAIVTAGGHKTLRITIYDADGNMRSMSETPLTGKTLASGDLDVLHDNLGDEVGHLIAKAEKLAAKKAPKPSPKVAEAPKPEPKKQTSDVTLSDGRTLHVVEPKKASQPKPEPVVAQAPMKKSAEPAELDMDTDDSAPETHEAAPVDTADVSADEIMKQTATSETDPTTTASSAGTPSDHELHIAAIAGIGMMSRSFTPGPATIAPYSTSPVGVVHLEGHAEPMRDLSIGVVFDRSLGMNTNLATEIAPTNITRWEMNAKYSLVHGDTFELDAVGGFGRRVFAIESSDPTRTPDSAYDYLIAGALAQVHFGRVALVGTAAYEPVVGGAEAEQMDFGSASRWALDVAAGIEVQASSHVYVRAMADYQQFSWSWDMAGARGAGGATDAYPSATVQLGARY